MLRIVVGRRGDAFEVYAGDCRLGEMQRSARPPGSTVWRWRVRLTQDADGAEPSLWRALDAIDRANGRQIN
jgi:hypothetical protein